MYFQVLGIFACFFGLFLIGSAGRVGVTLLGIGMLLIGYFDSHRAYQLLMIPAVLLLVGAFVSLLVSTKKTCAIVMAGAACYVAFVFHSLLH